MNKGKGWLKEPSRRAMASNCSVYLGSGCSAQLSTGNKVVMLVRPSYSNIVGLLAPVEHRTLTCRHPSTHFPSYTGMRFHFPVTSITLSLDEFLHFTFLPDLADFLLAHFRLRFRLFGPPSDLFDSPYISEVNALAEWRSLESLSFG